MRKISFFAILLLFLISCQKDLRVSKSDYVSFLKNQMKDSLSQQDFNNIDFSIIYETKVDNQRSLLRLHFVGTELSKQFLLLETTSKGRVLKGVIVEIDRNDLEVRREFGFNGLIKLRSLNRNSLHLLKIIDGYSSSFGQDRLSQRVVPAEKNVLPPVIVTTYVSTNATSSDVLVNWSSLLGSSSSNMHFPSAGYIPTTAEGSGGSNYIPSGTSGSGSSNDETAIVEVKSKFIDFEPSEHLNGIDVEKFLKCFTNVPDNGATCSIEILTDLPVDTEPNTFFNWQTGSPGHTFLQISKTNGTQSVVQNIGFYPTSSWKSVLTTAPIKGKFVDNGEHEFNAGLKMSVTPDELKKTLSRISHLGKFAKYDIDDYNCTDFALDVFNQTRISNALEIPRYNIPGGMAPYGTNTPQGLYNKLKILKQGGEGVGINIPGVKGWVSNSTGACN
jgi:hypothetical protein